jgi:hypothetical protein
MRVGVRRVGLSTFVGWGWGYNIEYAALFRLILTGGRLSRFRVSQLNGLSAVSARPAHTACRAWSFVRRIVFTFPGLPQPVVYTWRGLHAANMSASALRRKRNRCCGDCRQDCHHWRSPRKRGAVRVRPSSRCCGFLLGPTALALCCFRNAHWFRVGNTP